MANHSSDCEFCGEDMRGGVYGTCCDERQNKVQEDKAQAAKNERKYWELMEKYPRGNVYDCASREVKLMEIIDKLEDTLNQIYHYTDCTEYQMELINQTCPQKTHV